MNQIPEAFKLCSSSCLLSHSVTLPPTLSALGQSVCVCVFVRVFVRVCVLMSQLLRGKSTAVC